MEGRGFSDLLRNTSEEIFLKTMVENPIGITAPSMEMLGFKNISQSFRGDSEELFNSWLSNGEIPGFDSSSVAHRTRQVSRRISTDISPNQQNGASIQKKNNDDNVCAHNLNALDELSNEPGQHSQRNAEEKGMQGSNLYLAKAWFHSSQPMTRSRSSELRRRYAAMQSSQMVTIPQAPSNSIAHVAKKSQLDFTNASNFHELQMDEMPIQMHSFMSSSNSSTSFNVVPVAATDTVSTVISMLRGTLERKKLNSLGEKEMMEGSSCDMFVPHEAGSDISPNHGLGSEVVGPSTIFHMGSAGPINFARVEKSVDLSMEGFPTQANQARIGEISQEPSQSVVLALSTGFEVCDGPPNSGNTMSNGMSFSRHVGNGATDHELKVNDYRERVFGNSFKVARKKVNVRMGSISSAASEDEADPTKKRRVERSRKMAEAKEKNSTPAITSSMQSVLKRCENLEKEVRSLKLNLSFMNKKDSEQSRQIEELQNQNDELVNEKERLLEEIERIISAGKV